MRKNISLAIAVILLSGGAAHADESAKAKAMKMLDAMGGRSGMVGNSNNPQ